MAFTKLNKIEILGSAFLDDFHYKLGAIATANTRLGKEVFKGKTNDWDHGRTAFVALPNSATVTDGEEIIYPIPGNSEAEVPLTLSYRRKVVLPFTVDELTFDADGKFDTRFIEPMVKSLVISAERDVLRALTKGVTQYIGTPGVPITSTSPLFSVKDELENYGIPDEHYLYMNGKSYATMLAGDPMRTAFVQPLNADVQLKYMAGQLADLDVMRSKLIPVHAAGVGDNTATPANGLVDAGAVSVAVSSGTVLNLNGLNASVSGVFLDGDILEFPTIYSTQAPPVLESTGEPLRLTVVGDVDSDAGGNAIVNFRCNFYHTEGLTGTATGDEAPYRNFDTAAFGTATTDQEIPIGAAVKLVTANTGVGSTVKVAFIKNVAYGPDAILFAAPSLKPAGGGAKYTLVTDKETGISLKITEFYDGTMDKTITRVDIYYAIKILPQYIVGLLG